ncbi:MAG: XdhC family protein [Acidobacteria bacterium]|nr:XdhC family protein [Acidobacteriota bacterium]
MHQGVLKAVVEALERGEEAALVTIVAARGSTPQRVGAKMLVFADGRILGTIGGGCYENDAFWKARDALRTRRPQLVHYELTDDFAEESGLACGGQMDVFIEPLEPAARLYIVGAGHVGQQLARFAHAVGFRIHVIDDREKFANRERFPDADAIAVDAIPDWLAGTEFPATSYVVVVTRGHRHDLDAIRVLLQRDLRYLGLIGSRAKVKRIVDALLAEGLSPETFERIHAPIGFDIGAVTPEEIAISIVAELIAAKYGKLDEPHVAAASKRWQKLDRIARAAALPPLATVD